jgi:hypothetical protein
LLSQRNLRNALFLHNPNDGHPDSTREGSRQRIIVLAKHRGGESAANIPNKRYTGSPQRSDNPMMTTLTQPVKAVGSVSWFWLNIAATIANIIHATSKTYHYSNHWFYATCNLLPTSTCYR